MKRSTAAMALLMLAASFGAQGPAMPVFDNITHRGNEPWRRRTRWAAKRKPKPKTKRR